MKRKAIKIPAIVFAVIIALFFGKNIIVKTSVTAGVKAMTGLRLRIGSMNVGVFKSLIGINELHLHNPEGFGDDLMVDIPEIYVDYNLGAFFEGKTHLEEVRLHLKEFVVVKNEAGELNLNVLKAVKEAEEEIEAEERAEEDEGEEQQAAMPDIQIDLLDLKIDKVIYKDYSKGTSPNVKEYNVNIDEKYENISDAKSFDRLIIVKALKNTAIARLTNFNIGKLQEGISGTVKKTAEIAKKARGKIIETGKDVGEATGAAKETVEKAADTIKKLLPFGNKEEE